MTYREKTHRAEIFLDPGTWTLNPRTRIDRTTHVDITTTHVVELIGVEGGGLSRSGQDFFSRGAQHDSIR